MVKIFYLNIINCCLVIIMFSRTLRFLRRCKPLIATSILTFGYGLKKVAFEDISIERIEADMAKKYGQQQMLKKIKEKYVC